MVLATAPFCWFAWHPLHCLLLVLVSCTLQRFISWCLCFHPSLPFHLLQSITFLYHLFLPLPSPLTQVSPHHMQPNRQKPGFHNGRGDPHCHPHRAPKLTCWESRAAEWRLHPSSKLDWCVQLCLGLWTLLMAASALLNHISRVQLITLQQQFMLLLDKAMQVYSILDRPGVVKNSRNIWWLLVCIAPHTACVVMTSHFMNASFWKKLYLAQCRTSWLYLQTIPVTVRTSAVTKHGS